MTIWMIISVGMIVLPVAGICFWFHHRLNKLEKTTSALKFWQGSDVTRLEFDGLKNIVNRLRRIR